MKKVIGLIMILLLLAGSVCGIVFGCLYNSTRDRLQPFLEEEQGYLTIINSFEKTVAEQALKIEELSAIIETLSQENTENEQQLEEMSIQLSQAQTEIDQLTIDLETKKQILSQYTELSKELSAEISSLESSISDLQNQVLYYEKLIESYDLSNKNVITFTVLDKVKDVVVLNGDSLVEDEIVEPEYLGYNFDGWSVDGQTPIDLASYEFTEDTEVKAIMTEETQRYSFLFTFCVYSLVNVGTVRNYSYIADISICGSDVMNFDLQSVGEGSNKYCIDKYGEADPSYETFAYELEQFASVNENSVDFAIPMSFAAEQNPEYVYNHNYENYMSLLFTYDSSELTLTEAEYAGSNNNYHHTEIISGHHDIVLSDTLLESTTVSISSVEGSGTGERYNITFFNENGEIKFESPIDGAKLYKDGFLYTYIGTQYVYEVPEHDVLIACNEFISFVLNNGQICVVNHRAYSPTLTPDGVDLNYDLTLDYDYDFSYADEVA